MGGNIQILSSGGKVRLEPTTEKVVFNPSIVDLKTNLLAVWEFEETSGTNVNDSHTNNYDLTMISSPDVDQTGHLGKCFAYDGASGYCRYADTANDPFQVQSGLSFCAWIYRTGHTTTGSGVIANPISRYYSSTGYRIFTSNLYNSDELLANRLRFVYFDTNNLGTAINYDPPSDIFTNNWVHVAFTRDGDSMVMYINGNNVGDATGGTGSMQNATATTYTLVGGTAKSNSIPDGIFNGKIDQTAFWSIALTQSQIDELYNDGDGLTYSNWN